MESSVHMSTLRRLGLTLFLIAIVALTTGLQFASCTMLGGWQHRLEALIKCAQVQMVAYPKLQEPTASLDIDPCLFRPGENPRPLAVCTGNMPREIEGKIAAHNFVQKTSARVEIPLEENKNRCPCRCNTIVGMEPESDLFIRPWLEDDSVKSLNPREVWIGASSTLVPGDTVVIAGDEFRVTARLMPHWFDDSCYVRLDTLRDLAAKSQAAGQDCLNDALAHITSVDIKLKPEDVNGLSVKEATKILEDSIPEIHIGQLRNPPEGQSIQVLALIAATRVFSWLLWPGIMLCFAAVFSRFRQAKTRGNMGLELLKSAMLALGGSGVGLCSLYLLVPGWVFRNDNNFPRLSFPLYQYLTMLERLGAPSRYCLIVNAIVIPIIAVSLCLASLLISNLLSPRSGTGEVPESGGGHCK